MRLLASFLALVLIPLLAFAMTPELLCQQPDNFAQWGQDEQQQFKDVCGLAGQYEKSALPDEKATTKGVFREGKSALYNYEDFVGSLSKSLGSIQRTEICEADPAKNRVAYPSVSLEKTATGIIPVSVISEKELSEIYEEFAKDAAFAWEVPEEGCWARALMMTRALEKRGIRSAKMFAEGPFWVPSKDDQSPDKQWAYHVAPMVAVKTKNGIEMRVIDPALFEKPVAANKWGDKLFGLAAEKNSARVYVADRFTTAPLLDKPLNSYQTDPAKGRWHKAEILLAEQELKRLRAEAQRDVVDEEDQKAAQEFMNDVKAEEAP